jgi:hypothetical protein
MKSHFFGLFGLITFCTINAQDVENLSVPFFINGVKIQDAFAGGLNNPQFSEADLDLDGQDDILIFDRNGHVVLPFLYDPLQSRYRYEPDLVHVFPKIEDWLLARDFNKDGIIDIFCSSFRSGPAGIEVYQGFNSGGKLAFKSFSTYHPFNVLMWPTGNNKFTQIPVDYTDIPALEDVDHDGDLDILCFEPGGSRVYYFRNISLERGWGLDSLHFVLEDLCFGGFVESGFTSDIKLSSSKDSCASYFTGTEPKPRHAGSTLLSSDLNNDNLQDLLVGDLSSKHLTALYNSGSKNDAWMSSMDASWPKANIPVELQIFNAGFEVDVDKDGLKDILVAPNQRYLSKNTNNVLLYKKMGVVPGVSDYSFVGNNFIANQMLDFGSGACPVFVDYNQDGLLDILIGTEGIYIKDNILQSSLVLFENKGTLSQPEYHLVDSNYLNFRRFSAGDYPSYSFTPTFGDLDGDGDQDMLVGEHEGFLYFCENIAGAGKPFRFKEPVYGYQDINAKAQSVPWLYDLNQDGKLDLLIGTKTGNNNANFEPCSSFFYFENTGTNNVPKFNPDPRVAPNSQCVGNAIIEGQGSQMYSSPRIYELGGKIKMFSGGLLGKISVYEELEGNLYGKFKLVNSNYGNFRQGERLHFDMADIDSDGILEIITGNYRGGISLGKTRMRTDGTMVNNSDEYSLSLKMYPNPSSGLIYIESDPGKLVEIEILNMMGISCFVSSILLGTDGIAPIHINLASGMYLVRLKEGFSSTTQPLFVK